MIASAQRRDILGCNFHSVTTTDALAHISDWSSHEERRTHTIVTVNVAILMLMRSDKRLAEAVSKADLVVADGAPIVWVSKWLRSRLPERVTGIDLMERMLEEGSRQRLRVFLLGTTEERLRALVRTVQLRYPGVEIAGCRNGYFSAAEHDDIVRQVRESRADVLLVGMPAPFKEIWCEDHRDALQTPAVLGVGGAFDVMAGFVARAPKPLQTVGLEWLWRLAMEPRKLWRRYLTTNSQFIAAVIGELTRNQTRRI